MIILIKSSLPDPRRPSRGIFALKLAYYLSQYESVVVCYPAFRGDVAYSLGLLPWVDKSRLNIMPLVSFPGLNRFPYIQNLLWTLQLYLKINGHVANERICIFAYFFFPGAPLFANLKRIFNNIITVVHHSESIDIHSMSPSCKINIFPLFRSTNLVIVNNPDYETDLLKLNSDRISESNVKIKYIPSGYDDRAVKLVLSRVKSESALHTSDYSQLNICCIGTITPRKGQQTIINALARLDLSTKSNQYYRYERICLNLIGPHEVALSIPQLDNIHINFLGSLPHEDCLIKLIYNDLVCQPSSSEGMSNVVVEAIALRKPIVMSDIPSNRYLASPNTKSLFPSSCNTDHLATLFRSIITGELDIESLIIDPVNVLTLSQRARKVYEAINE